MLLLLLLLLILKKWIILNKWKNKWIILTLLKTMKMVLLTPHLPRESHERIEGYLMNKKSRCLSS